MLTADRQLYFLADTFDSTCGTALLGWPLSSCNVVSLRSTQRISVLQIKKNNLKPRCIRGKAKCFWVVLKEKHSLWDDSRKVGEGNNGFRGTWSIKFLSRWVQEHWIEVLHLTWTDRMSPHFRIKHKLYNFIDRVIEEISWKTFATKFTFIILI